MDLQPAKQFELRTVNGGVKEVLTMKDVQERWKAAWTFRAYAKVGDKIAVSDGVLVRVQ